MKLHNSELRERLAAEYALGTLQGLARRRFDRMAAQDADLRRRIRHWEQRLVPLAEEMSPIQPPEHVWARISERLDQETSDPAPDPAPTSSRGPAGRWQSWRWPAMAAAAVLVAFLSLTFLTDTGHRSPELWAVVQDPEAQPTWILSTHPDGTRIEARALRNPGMEPERVCKLWLVWDDGTVQGAGILPEDGKRVVHVEERTDRSLGGVRLVVSVEPADRIPTDQPAGDVIFSGGWIAL